MTSRFFNFLLVAVFVSGVLFENVSSRLTDKQVTATLKLVRNMCAGRAKATPEEIDKMQQGNWDVDYNAKCYIWCALHTNKLMDDSNKIDLTVVTSQVNTLPEHWTEHVLASTSKCEHAATNLDDKCVAAWEFAKCIYLVDPKQYFLP